MYVQNALYQSICISLNKSRYLNATYALQITYIHSFAKKYTCCINVTRKYDKDMIYCRENT